MADISPNHLGSSLIVLGATSCYCFIEAQPIEIKSAVITIKQKPLSNNNPFKELTINSSNFQL